jgi:putative ABC transport system substrate-binding protein
VPSAFSNALRELGWIEGKSIAFDYRNAGDSNHRLPMLAAELVRLSVDVIVANGTQASLAAKRATSKIPIVMGGAIDPIGSGLVVSLGQPGGNVTGTSSMQSTELAAKRLQMLKEILPTLSRVAVLGGSKETVDAAQIFGIQLYPVNAASPADLKNKFSAAMRFQPEALITDLTPFTVSHTKPIVDIATNIRLPSIYPVRPFVDVGGLMSYGPDLADGWRLLASYVDKILNGSRPADLAVQQPSRFQLVINLKTAKVLGLTIPPTLLARADELIE